MEDTMRDYAGYVNVFQGCDEIDLPTPEGVAAAWRFIKGLCGNNSPGAATPFGKMSVCCYSGGYSSGYGRLMANSHGSIRKLFDRNKVIGFAHLQNDGSGYIDTFYNYAVATPFYGALAASHAVSDFQDEHAEPGYYALTMQESGIVCEMTTSPRVAVHQYTYPRPGGRLAIDFANDGLYDDGNLTRSLPGACRLMLIGDDAIAARVVLHGLPLYFFARIEGAHTPLKLWVNDAEIEERVLELPEGRQAFGCVCDALGDALTVRLSLSPRSPDIARADVLAEGRTLDAVRKAARALWNEALSRIDATFDDPRDQEIFYSNFYHTLTKPCDWSGESFLYKEDAFVLDFATLWDQYKTQLPLIYALYPGMGEKIAATILYTARATGRMPHQFMLDNNHATNANGQARMLAGYTLTDAYLRGVPFDVREAVRLLQADVFEQGHYDDVLSDHTGRQSAFLIDICSACASAALLAREAGDPEAAARFDAVAARWPEAYDPKTGLVWKKSYFYEGTHWNYSFRLMHDMAGRMALSGGSEAFAAQLDRFFGFSHPEDIRSCCFEGFNNETDMETPYAYHFAGRHDRLAEVIDAGLRYVFTTGRGGLPGNNDNGGLTSCYLWNALGIFPVTGQDLMLIGTPRIRRARLSLWNGREFRIEKHGEGIYVQQARLDEQPLDDLCFSVRRMMEGGVLELFMQG
ncbi:MAG: glycoside hydrolase family 92 protein [Oscillospiraceae bacterium]|jgi:putative alpha-1,2-mannosidase|nr:glycoside hydrolase family 92 protein [Oscillospiraceae bacterium]